MPEATWAHTPEATCMAQKRLGFEDPIGAKIRRWISACLRWPMDFELAHDPLEAISSTTCTPEDLHGI